LVGVVEDTIDPDRGDWPDRETRPVDEHNARLTLDRSVDEFIFVDVVAFGFRAPRLVVGLSTRDLVHDLHGIADPDARGLRPGYVDDSGNDERQSSGTMEARHITLLHSVYILRKIS
jgi:hypothetical protein